MIGPKKKLWGVWYKNDRFHSNVWDDKIFDTYAIIIDKVNKRKESYKNHVGFEFFIKQYNK